MNEITDEKLMKYFDVTGRALKKAKIVDSGNVDDWKAAAEDFYDMAVSRELRMKELKEQMEEMKEEMGKLKKELEEHKKLRKPDS